MTSKEHDKFEIENSSCDIVAILTYRTKEQGGRSTPVQSGYRPHIKFDSIYMMTSGTQFFIDKKTVYPGDEFITEIKLLSPQFYAHSLQEGSKFEFCEGSVVIGTGVVKHIINEVLKKHVQ